jgi:hypothetical protein
MVSVSSHSNLSFQQKHNNKKEASFGFVNASNIATTLDMLKQNPVLEVAVLDLTTMVAPRTVIDYNQNPDYGKETLFRELAPVIFNPYGPTIVAAALMAKMGYKGVHAGRDTLQTLHSIWQETKGNDFHAPNATETHKHNAIKNYANGIIERISSTTTQNNNFTELTPEHKEALSDKIAHLILSNKEGKEHKDKMGEAANYFTTHTKTSECLQVKFSEEHKFSANIKTILEDVVSTGRKIFTNPAVQKLEGAETGVIKKLVGFAPKKTLLGAGLSIASIITLPAINNAITKYRTGKSGYVAYQDDGKNVEIVPDKGAVFRAKAMGVAVIGSIMLTTMGAFGKKGFFKLGKNGFFKEGGGGKNFLDKIELKGKDAGMDLIKLIYGSSLISRVMFSRDDQEAKNTTLRDSCGFLNWLVLGGFVTKLFGYFGDKTKGTFVNITGKIKDTEEKNVIKRTFNTRSNWLNNVSLKSLNEIKVMNVPEAEMKKNIRWHTISNFAGLAWAMLTLGIAMPIINNTLTNRARAKQLEARKKSQQNKALALPPKVQASAPVKQETFEYTGIKPDKDLKHFIKQFE